MDVRIRRVYDEVRDDDGRRVLVDRLWPRGLSKEAAVFDEWAKDVTPSTELRKWYGHDDARWDEFRARYRAELDGEAAAAVAALVASADGGRLTLLTATRDLSRGHVLVLADVLREVRGHEPGLRTRLGAYCLVTEDDRVLLAQVADGYPGAGRWTLPGGGVDWGEQPDDGALRELFEETGLVGTDPVLLDASTKSFGSDESMLGDRLFWIRLLYGVTASGTPEVTELDGSTARAAWHPIVDLDDLPTVDIVDLARPFLA